MTKYDVENTEIHTSSNEESTVFGRWKQKRDGGLSPDQSASQVDTVMFFYKEAYKNQMERKVDTLHLKRKN